MARFDTLGEWLRWQESLHSSEIDLGLDRVRKVFSRLVGKARDFKLITVAGTNGKGSSVAMLESVLLASGCRVASYTSPHLFAYNERIRLNGEIVSDKLLCDAFARVDRARRSVSLSYFEFGTLAAIDIFYRSRLDVVILEVGLGGRLDATNVMDADVALVTTVGIDHVEWLGGDRESIGFEKAGIFRAGRPAVCGEREPPDSLLSHAKSVGSSLYRLGVDYDFVDHGSKWYWSGGGKEPPLELPAPALEGALQKQNAAAALMALRLLPLDCKITHDDICRGLSSVSLHGRVQTVVSAKGVQQIFDVAHNPQAASVLSDTLQSRHCDGRTFAVMAMLRDKDVASVVRQLAALVERWYVAGLDVSRGLSATELAGALDRAGVDDPVFEHAGVAVALEAALADAKSQDRIVVFGSFHTVAQGLAAVNYSQ